MKMAIQQANTPQEPDETTEEFSIQEGHEELVEEKKPTPNKPFPRQSKWSNPNPLQQSARLNKGTHPKTYANHMATVIAGDDSVAAAKAVAAIKEVLGRSLVSLG